MLLMKSSIFHFWLFFLNIGTSYMWNILIIFFISLYLYNLYFSIQNSCMSWPVYLSPVAPVQAAAAPPSQAKGQWSGGGGTLAGYHPVGTGGSYSVPCFPFQTQCTDPQLLQLWMQKQLNVLAVLLLLYKPKPEVMSLTHMSEQRCPVHNVNLCGIHWQREKGGVFWNRKHGVITEWIVDNTCIIAATNDYYHYWSLLWLIR